MTLTRIAAAMLVLVLSLPMVGTAQEEQGEREPEWIPEPAPNWCLTAVGSSYMYSRNDTCHVTLKSNGELWLEASDNDSRRSLLRVDANGRVIYEGTYVTTQSGRINVLDDSFVIAEKCMWWLSYLPERIKRQMPGPYRTSR